MCAPDAQASRDRPASAGRAGSASRAPTYLFAGGGTGGHLSPALAIAERLTEIAPACRTQFICSQRPIDARMLTEAGVRHEAIPAAPFSIRPGAAWRFVRGYRSSVQQVGRVLESQPVVSVIALGGYVAAPVVAAAAARGVPVTLLNLDARPGKANRWMARRCAPVLTAVPLPEHPRFADRVVGLPVRRSALAPGSPAACRTALGLDPSRRTLLVTGASQGAASINEMMIALVESRPDLLTSWQVYHLAGPDRLGTWSAAYEAAGVRAVVEPFQTRMGLAWGAADLAISRAGASSVAEAGANAIPTIFMPYPFHRDQHQRHNAQPLVDRGGAIIIEDLVDARRTAASIAPVLEALGAGPDRLEEMRSRLEAMERADAAERIAHLLIDAAQPALQASAPASTAPRGRS